MLSLDTTVDFFEGFVPDSKPKGYWLTFERVLDALEKARVRPVFAGALALQAHGVVRSTTDIDLLIRPDDRGKVLSALGRSFKLRHDLDTQIVFDDVKTAIEVDVLVGYDQISVSACESPQRNTVRGHVVNVVKLPDLVAMKAVAAVDSPAIEPKQRLDIDSLLRRGKVPVNEVSRLLQDEVGVEYARYFMDIVKHVRAHPTPIAPRRRPIKAAKS